MNRKLLAIFASFLFSSPCFAQNKANVSKCDSLKLLEIGLFNKMIVQDITYAIIGEATPTSGVKVDISKPEATISGLFKPKNTKLFDLYGFEFKGGISDRNFSIWKGRGSFGTAFEFKPSFHWIPYWSSGKFGACDVAEPAAILINAKHQIVRANAKALQDSIAAIAVIRKYHLQMANIPDDPTITIPTDANLTDSQKLLVIYFAKKFSKKDKEHRDLTDNLSGILNLLPKANVANGKMDVNSYLDEIEETYKKYIQLGKASDDDVDSKMIANAQGVWTKKTYHWFTFIPSFKTEKVNEYYTKFEGKDSSYFKSDYRFYGGGTMYYSYYTVIPNRRAHLFRAALSLLFTNNLTSLSGYNYEKQTPFFSYGTAVTNKTQTGSAFNKSDIKTGYSKQVMIDYYRLPLKSLVPGVYFSANLNLGKLYELPSVVGRESDKVQFAAEGGLVFNVRSREKDKEKSIFSILLYARHEDFTDKRRTDNTTKIEETSDDFLKRNFGMGIRVGIPITLPQNSN